MENFVPFFTSPPNKAHQTRKSLKTGRLSSRFFFLIGHFGNLYPSRRQHMRFGAIHDDFVMLLCPDKE